MTESCVGCVCECVHVYKCAYMSVNVHVSVCACEYACMFVCGHCVHVLNRVCVHGEHDQGNHVCDPGTPEAEAGGCEG